MTNKMMNKAERSRTNYFFENNKSKIFLKALLSIWLVYHLFCIVILPNGASFLGRYFESYILPYANSIGINSTWNFYSPDPAHTMYFSYTVYFENEQGEEIKPPLEQFLPPEKNQIVVDSSKRRLLYAMRYLALDQKRMQTLLAPWICRENTGASRVSIHHVIERIPTLDMAMANLSKNVDELREQSESQSEEFNCRHLPDEASL